MTKVSGRVVMSILFCLLVSLLAYAQDKKSRVVKEQHYEGPVEIVGLSIQGQTANFLKEISAGKDWLKTLTLNIKNNHNKSIVHMEVGLEIAKAGKMDYPLLLSINFGQMPPTAEENQPLKLLKKVAPNSTKKLSLSESSYNFLVNYMRENQVDDIDEVEVSIQFVLFDDDTAWSKGHLMRRDPNNPNNWVVDGVWLNGGASFFKTFDNKPRDSLLSAQCQSPVPIGLPQYSSSKVSKWPLSFITINYKFLPLANPLTNGVNINKPILIDDDTRPTCTYLLSRLPQPCGSSPCSGTNSYCTVLNDKITRNRPN